MENFEVNNYGGFSHLSEDLIYHQITQFAEYVVNALPKGADETKAISALNSPGSFPLDSHQFS